MKDEIKMSVRKINEWLGIDGGYISYKPEWSFKSFCGRQKIARARRLKGVLELRCVSHGGMVDWVPVSMFQSKIDHAVRRESLELV